MTRSLGPLLVLLGLLCGCSHNSAYYLKRGDQLAAAGKLADAEVNYRKAIQTEPNNGAAYLQLASLSERLHNPQQAYQALSEAVKLLPSRVDIKVKLAELLLSAYLSDQRRSSVMYDRVLKLCNEMDAAEPGSFDAVRIKAHLAAGSGDYDQAEQLYVQANRIKASHPDVILGWSETLFKQNRPKDGEQLALSFISSDKTYAPMYQLLYRHYVSQKRTADAERILELQSSNNPANANYILELAAFYASSARESDMNAALRPLLDDSKTFPDGPLRVGDLYARLQRWDDALRVYEQGGAKSPEHKLDYLKHIADLWLLQGKGERAQGIVQEILKAAPDDPQAKGVEASLLLASGKPDDIARSATALGELVNKYPENPALHFNLGRALAAKGGVDNARAQFQEAIRLRPDFLQPRLALIEMSEAKSDYKAALEYANETLTRFPDLMRMRLVRAVSLVYTGQTASGEAELSKLGREFPNDSEVQLQSGIVALRQKNFSAAEQHFRTLLQSDKNDVRPMRALAYTLQAENQVDKAIVFLQDELKKSPSSVAVRSTLAQTAAIAGNYDLAIEEYRQLVAAAPNSEQAHLALGVVYRMKRDLPDAVQEFRTAHGLAPKDASPLENLGGALALASQNKEALSTLRDALRMGAEDGNTLNNAAFLICETGGNLDEAMAMAQKALKAQPDSPNFTDTIGWIYLKKHLPDSAVQVFQSLNDKYPANATFRYHLGMAFLDKGNKAEAGAQLKQALAQKPSDDVKRNIEAALAKTS